MYSLGKVLGPAFTPAAQAVWIKIYSRMLKVILPRAADLEFYSPSNMVHIPTLLPPPAPEQEPVRYDSTDANDEQQGPVRKVAKKERATAQEPLVSQQEHVDTSLYYQKEEEGEGVDGDNGSVSTANLLNGKPASKCPFSSLQSDLRSPAGQEIKDKGEYLKALCSAVIVMVSCCAVVITLPVINLAE